ncbi:MAG: ABC transporter substrate-binding protein [Pseudomonadota bacterium]
MNAIKCLCLAASLCAMVVSSSHADEASEAFVEENARLVLTTLGNPDLDANERTNAFNAYMNEFSNFDRVSSFVIGKYSRRFTEMELQRYRDAFRAYSLASYEVQFDDYRGSEIDVKGSTDRSERDSIVDTIVMRSDGELLDVRWRVLKRGDTYEVVDVALNIDGQLLWLAIEQRAQFLDLLDRNNGSADALIAKLEELTADLKAR